MFISRATSRYYNFCSMINVSKLCVLCKLCHFFLQRTAKEACLRAKFAYAHKNILHALCDNEHGLDFHIYNPVRNEHSSEAINIKSSHKIVHGTTDVKTAK